MPDDERDHEEFQRVMARNGLGGASRLDLYNSEHLANGYGVDVDGGLGRVKKPVWLLGGVLVFFLVVLPLGLIAYEEFF